MNKLMNLKKDKKGFTLIEIVIVLVIIAILAAILVPSITGWIKKSNYKAFLSEADSVKQACQSQMADSLATGEGYSTTDHALKDEDPDEVKKKFDKTIDTDNITFTLDDEGRMTKFHYENTKYKIDYDTTGDKKGWQPVKDNK